MKPIMMFNIPLLRDHLLFKTAYCCILGGLSSKGFTVYDIKTSVIRAVLNITCERKMGGGIYLGMYLYMALYLLHHLQSCGLVRSGRK